MAGNYTRYPNPSSSNASVGTTGNTAPSSATEIGGVDGSGDLVAVSVDSSGNVNANIVNFSPSSPIPTDLEKVGGTAVTLGQKAMAASIPMVIASDQSAVPSSQSGVWSVTATQTTGTNLHTVVDSGSVSATQSGTWNINNISGTVSLPTGAATDALQTTGNSSLSSINGKLGSLGQKTMSGSAPVVIASDQSAIPVSQSGSWSVTASGTVAVTQSTSPWVNNISQFGGNNVVTGTGASGSGIPRVTVSNDSNILATQSGTWTVQPGNTANTTAWLVNNGSKTKANTPVFNDNSGNNITTSAYLQLVASTSSACSQVECYNQTASSIYFATGASLSEINQFIIPPGGNGFVPLSIAASTRISVKAVDTTASTGSLIVNFWT